MLLQVLRAFYGFLKVCADALLFGRGGDTIRYTECARLVHLDSYFWLCFIHIRASGL